MSTKQIRTQTEPVRLTNRMKSFEDSRSKRSPDPALNFSVVPFEESSPYRDSIEQLYNRSFPDSERKPFPMILSGVRQGKMELYTAVVDGRPVALIFLILGEPFDVLDYLAVDESARSLGIGSRIMTWLQTIRGRAFIVEIESTIRSDDPQMIRRKEFYLRGGLVDCRQEIELFGVDMELLAWPKTASFEEYHAILRAYFGEELARNVKEL